jgi:hypothetical protein
VQPSYSINLSESAGQKVVWLAAVGLALNPDDLARELIYHYPSPEGAICAGCGERWWCPLGVIAHYARWLTKMAREGAEPALLR